MSRSLSPSEARKMAAARKTNAGGRPKILCAGNCWHAHGRLPRAAGVLKGKTMQRIASTARGIGATA